MRAWAATPEHVILVELAWASESGSDRQIEDAGGIIRRHGASLYGSYASGWVKKISLEREGEKAKRFAGS